MVDLVKRLWRTFSELDTTITVFGWIKLGVGVMASLVAVIWAWIESQPASILFVLSLASLLITVYLVNAVLWLWKQWRPGNKQLEEASEIDALVASPIFYPDAEVHDRESPLADKMRSVERMDAMWLTGTKAIVEVQAVDKVDRLLLPNPESESLKYFQSVAENPRDLGEEIRDSTIQAKRKGIEVRWLTEFVGYSLTIWNPKSDNASVSIKMCLPVIHGSRHPCFEFKKPKHAATVDDIIKIFNELWSEKHSKEPRL